MKKDSVCPAVEIYVNFQPRICGMNFVPCIRIMIGHCG